jgi:DNA-damage-inducible protein J
MTADSIVRARIDAKTKRKAADALESMGLSVSDAIRMLLVRVAAEQALPFEARIPNAKTARAMKEARTKKLPKAKNAKDFMAALNADD